MEEAHNTGLILNGAFSDAPPQSDGEKHGGRNNVDCDNARAAQRRRKIPAADEGSAEPKNECGNEAKRERIVATPQAKAGDRGEAEKNPADRQCDAI